MLFLDCTKPFFKFIVRYSIALGNGAMFISLPIRARADKYQRPLRSHLIWEWMSVFTFNCYLKKSVCEGGRLARPVGFFCLFCLFVWGVFSLIILCSTLIYFFIRWPTVYTGTRGNEVSHGERHAAKVPSWTLLRGTETRGLHPNPWATITCLSLWWRSLMKPCRGMVWELMRFVWTGASAAIL